MFLKQGIGRYENNPIYFVDWMQAGIVSGWGKKYTAELHHQYYLTEDGNYLPLRSWFPDKSKLPRAIVMGMHGFNDYSHFFQQPAEFLSKLGIICFAYDQRGFGASSQCSFWAGTETYTEDLQSFVNLVKQNYPDLPVYLLGESMGGAVVIATIREARMPKIEGIILVAPAVWSREIMPWYQTSLLWLLAPHTRPWLNLSGEGWVVKLSDNREMIKALDTDPHALRKTRVESMYGLMDLTFYNASYIGEKTLLLYGEKDNFIQKDASYLFLKRLFEGGVKVKAVAFYPKGYCLLLRDLNAEIVWKDIAAWIFTKGEVELPSGAGTRANHQLLNPLFACN